MRRLAKEFVDMRQVFVCQSSVHENGVAVLSDQPEQVRCRRIGVFVIIDPFYGKVEDHDVQEELVLHRLGFPEGVEIFCQFGQTLFKKSRQAAVNLSQVIDC